MSRKKKKRQKHAALKRNEFSGWIKLSHHMFVEPWLKLETNPKLFWCISPSLSNSHTRTVLSNLNSWSPLSTPTLTLWARAGQCCAAQERRQWRSAINNDQQGYKMTSSPVHISGRFLSSKINKADFDFLFLTKYTLLVFLLCAFRMNVCVAPTC